MIPSKNDPRWKDLINGNIHYQFKLVSAGMCLSRNQRHYQQAPTETTYNEALDQLHAFFIKYESLLAEDLPHIFH